MNHDPKEFVNIPYTPGCAPLEKSTISWEFFDDEAAYSKTEYMMMIRKWIVVSPILASNNDKSYSYLPNPDWYDFNTLK